jgi:glutamate-1-semialdehyde 2,1-aminomutase
MTAPALPPFPAPAHPATRAGIAQDGLARFAADERARFIDANPASRLAAGRASAHWLFGVPMHWLADWETPFTLHVAQAAGAQVVDADGNARIDFCLGDTGAMFGHAPEPVVAAVQRQLARGSTALLAGADGDALGAELARRFGLPLWQVAATASDANRFMLRWVRAATRRPVLVVFNGCYHGTVDDVFVDLVDGVPRMRPSLLGQVHDLGATTRVVEFNDLPALEAALAPGDVACVLAEPVMTNVGMVLPQPGFWPAARALARRHGAMLVFDETHTISSGPGGHARAEGVVPDGLVIGKPIGGGLPCAVYGFSAALGEAAMAAKRAAPPGHSGIGTTLSSNLLAMAAMRATLCEVATEAAYAHMHARAGEIAQGLREAIARHRLPWCVTQAGARCEFQFGPVAPRDGSAAMRMMDAGLESLIHLALLNRGVMITPFHNMLLACPATTREDVQRLLAAFDDVLARLAGSAR